MIISIIGGGATGMAVAIALIDEIQKNILKEQVIIQIFEPNALGEGLAYRDISNKFILNTTVDTMSVVKSDKFHFYKWIEENRNKYKSYFQHEQKITPKSFVPRALIAKYIKDTFDQKIMEIKNPELKIKWIKQEVIDIQYNQSNGLIKVYTKNKFFKSDCCILCTGYSNGIPQAYQNMMKYKNYYGSIYLYENEINKIQKNKKILIIGTGLSGIDAAIFLEKNMDITMASRTGVLPAVRSNKNIKTKMHLTKSYTKHILSKHASHISAKFIKKEIDKEISRVYKTKTSLMDLRMYNDQKNELKFEIYLSRHNLNLYSSCIIRLITFVNLSWNYLPLHEKKLLMYNEFKEIQRYISSFPYENAKKLYEMLMEKTLKITGGLRHIEKQKNIFIAEFSRGKRIKFEKFNFVINATSPENNLNNINNRLYRKLIHNRIIQTNNFGGINVNFKMQMIDSVIPSNLMYAAGPITKGCFLITNFLGSSVKQAKIIAKEIICQIKT